MRAKIFGLVSAAALTLAGCENLTDDQQMFVGGLGGATAGLITAEVLDADDDWRLIAALAGATAGTLVARNNDTGMCAYARGDGTYYRAACPRNY
ncbi:glycine zipper 2TM domain-containing protein [Tranquillimonas alkanivorans]|uniref:17 kDa surface antigen n=1 Tax=Tranquillimonas alkanivorans TaxID=441119 RepID=A0A1I5REF2_9RHOB|nr:glycine zipper 2TM domain-containing protein [Tranquillimonas alkanivorans]SFP56902.1 hypothetical protein SAMN04488047_108136 [Tranquillimonas alkanivorans]